MTKSTLFSKRVPAAVMAIIFVFTGMAIPRPAHAIWGIEDISFDPTVWATDIYNLFFSEEGNFKEFVLDPLAWAAAKAAISSITQSTVNWINSGFEGSPAFETDLRRSMGNLQDSVANNFFNSLETNTGIDADAPFKEQVSSYLKTSYYKSTSGSKGFWEDGLSKNTNGEEPGEITENLKKFREGQISGNGGWDKFFQQASNEKNNTYGAVRDAQFNLFKNIESFRVQRLNELQWGDGFLSWKGSCTKFADPDKDATVITGNEECLEYETKTPGSVIVSAGNANLQSTLRQLEVADEIDEILGALMQQLIQQVMSEEGLSGLSKPSSGGGKSYIDRAAGGEGSNDLGARFLVVVDAQKKKIEKFIKNWQTIKDIATEAQRACSTASNSERKQEITDTLALTDPGLAKGNAALTLINSLRAEAVAAMATTTNRTLAVGQVSEKYREASESGKLLQTEEMTDVENEARDFGSAMTDPKNMYNKMKKYRDDCAQKKP